MKYLSLDFETRSEVDLRKTSVYRYAEHPSTDIWCMAWAIGDDEPEIWVPGDPVPDEVAEWVLNDRPLRAWNAMFERVIWRFILGPRYGFPLPKLEQFYCTQAEAYAQNLPGALAKAAKILGVTDGKDMAGRRLMLQMAKPRRYEDGHPVWWDEMEKRERLYAYCKQDVRVEREIAKRIRRLGPRERQVYLLDQRINDRGVPIDVELVEAMGRIQRRTIREANRELKSLTDGAVSTINQVGKLTEWLHEQEVEIPNLKKVTVEGYLEKEGLPAAPRRALELRSQTAKASVKKVPKILEVVNSDGRARGLLKYHAAGTGRWAGRLIQPQNLPRPTLDDPEEWIPRVLAEDEKVDLEILSSLLRSTIASHDGKRLIANDYSQIEARIVTWIAEQDDILARWAQEDPRIYEKMATTIFGMDEAEVEKGSFERQIGKNSVLGCGFQMGAERFREQVYEQTGMRIENDLAERAVYGYRDLHWRVKAFWYEIEAAALRAVLAPGEVFSVGRRDMLKYVVRRGVLWCILPSGRPLAYSLPKAEMQKTPWGEDKLAVTFCGIPAYPPKKWRRLTLYGGWLTENVVQAMARDLLADAMFRLEAHGYPSVLTVHDEVLSEVPKGQGSQEEAAALMAQRPDWACDLPVAVEGWEGRRYRK